MKKILALLAVLTVSGIAAPSVSQAWDRCSSGFQPRVVSYLPCGRPVYAVYQVYGYDRCGNPLGRWVTQREACGCNACNPRPHCAPSHGHFGHAPFVPSHRSRGVSWSFSFGR
jgi:hypothetical protein